MRSRAVIVVAILCGSLVTGGWLLQQGARGGGPAGYNGARLFDEVRSHVERFYVDTIQPAQLYDKAVDGLLYELRDPHSAFLSRERLARLTESTTGQYAGLGIQIDVRDGWITVVAPLPGTPADRAGIQMGDRIVEIETKSTRDWTVDEATKVLRGLPGSKVSFLVERPGVEARLPFTLERRAIHVRAVQRVTMLTPAVGYLDVNVFSDSSTYEVAMAVDSLTALGMKTLVIDLRGNPGGLLGEGVAMSDLFLDEGKAIVRTRGRTADANQTFVDRAAQRWPTLPIVVLVNEGSASAAEILAGALQDHDRAVLVGRTSYGKGSAQSVFPVSAGGALKLTTALWYTPAGRSINKPHSRSGDDDDEAGDESPPDVAEPAKREPYTTDAGRTVYGGGGITPDVIAGDTALDADAKALQQALGALVPRFRDAIGDYAVSLKVARAISSPDFTVTPAMREELWRRMLARKIVIDRPRYDAAAPLVSRLLTYEVARLVFGPAAEFRRIARDDKVIDQALRLAAGVTSQRELLDRAAALHTSDKPAGDTLTK